jgi:hypothetical protein
MMVAQAHHTIKSALRELFASFSLPSVKTLIEKDFRRLRRG